MIAIIAILAALLTPAVKKTIDSANATKAASNLRHLAMAEIQYAGDNNQCFTRGYATAGDSTWQSLLLPYIIAGGGRQDPKSVFNMPGAKIPGSGGITSVGLNQYLPWAQLPPSPRYWNYRANLVQRPSSIILLGEIEARNNDYIEPPDYSMGGAKPGFRRQNNTKALVAFCDGHVDALSSISLLSTLPNSTNPWFWW